MHGQRLIPPGRKYFGMEVDQALIDTQMEILDKKLDAYDVILSKQRYVAGDVRPCPRLLCIQILTVAVL
jgi:hypothetical protein